MSKTALPEGWTQPYSNDPLTARKTYFGGDWVEVDIDEEDLQVSSEHGDCYTVPLTVIRALMARLEEPSSDL